MIKNLEEIKSRTLYGTYREMGTDNVVKVDIKIKEKDFKWLIETIKLLDQIRYDFADRITDQHKKIRELEAENEILSNENKRYREAIEEAIELLEIIEWEEEALEESK